MAELKKLTDRQIVARGEESQSKPTTRHSTRKNNAGLTGCIPIALLPKPEGMGMTPSSIPNMYKNDVGDLCNSQGIVFNDMPDCLVCQDAGFVKIDPREIGRVSEGAWHSLRVPCPKWNKDRRRCAV